MCEFQNVGCWSRYLWNRSDKQCFLCNPVNQVIFQNVRMPWDPDKSQMCTLMLQSMYDLWNEWSCLVIEDDIMEWIVASESVQIVSRDK